MKMEQGARIVVEDWLQAQSDDVLHFITDETKLREAEAFAAAARQVGAIPKLTVLPSAFIQGGRQRGADAADHVLCHGSYRRNQRFLHHHRCGGLCPAPGGTFFVAAPFLQRRTFPVGAGLSGDEPGGCRPDGAAFAALPAPRRPRSHHHQTGYGHHLRYPGTEAGSVSRCCRPSRSLRLGKL